MNLPLPNLADKATAASSSSSVAIRHVTLDKIRLVFKDVVTGNDAEAWLDHLDTKIDKIDPDQSHFDIPEITIDGLIARVYQAKPLANPEPVSKDIAEATQPAGFNLDLKKISLGRLQFDYRNDVSAFYTNVKLNKADIVVNELDMTNRLIDLKNISGDDIIADIRLGKKEQAKIVVREAEKEIETRADAGWRVLVNQINLDNNKLRFDNDNIPVQKQGMDYAHLLVDSLTLHVDDLVLRQDSIGGQITRAEFREKSGFILEQLETKFLYAGNQTYLRDLVSENSRHRIKKRCSNSICLL